MHEEEIRVLGRGDYFGEQSLIKEDKRSANIIAMAPGVECLTLDRGAFKQLIGNLEELHSIDYGDRDRLMKRNIDNQRRKLIQDNERSLKGNFRIENHRKGTKSTLLFLAGTEYDDIEFKQLKSVAVVGVGGFGRVVIVKHGKDDNFKVFALKQMKKAHIVETKQEEHVFNERRIMMSCKLNEIDFSIFFNLRESSGDKSSPRFIYFFETIQQFLLLIFMCVKKCVLGSYEIEIMIYFAHVLIIFCCIWFFSHPSQLI